MSPRAAVRALPLLVLALGCLAPPLRAATKIEGDYQLMMDLRKNDRPYLWQFDSNSYDVFDNIGFRVFSQPLAGVETFVKFEANYSPSDNNNPQPEFHYREAHLRFRKEFGKRGIDSYVFSRQDRFYSNTYLIPWFYGRGDAQGIRVDTWGFAKTNATFIVADRSGEYDPSSFPSVPHLPRDSIAAQRILRTSDQYQVRLRREFFADGRLRTGLSFSRYESWMGRDSVSGASPWNSVLGFDGRLRVRGADVALEYGESRDVVVRDESVRAPQFTVGKRALPFRLPDRGVVQAEIRSLKLGTAGTGFLSVTPGWWSRGPKWQNAVGGPTPDETGFSVSSYYLLPERAMTYSNNLLWYGARANSQTKTRQIYNEMYVEFINGFTGKTSYRRTDTYRRAGPYTNIETHLDWFNELQVESRLAWLRIQGKVRDIGTPDKKQLFVVENSLNLSPKTKIYNRFAFGNDPSILRKGIFMQLQYRPTGNMEMFLQYGPDYIGGGSMPVDEGNLNGGGDQKDIVKFILKGNF
jgi:hypothetical protein